MLNIINFIFKIPMTERIWSIISYVVVLILAISLIVSYILFFKLQKLYDNRYQEGSKL